MWEIEVGAVWQGFCKSLLLFLGSLRLFVPIGCGISVWTALFVSFWNQCCIGGFRYDGSIVKSYHSLFQIWVWLENGYPILTDSVVDSHFHLSSLSKYIKMLGSWPDFETHLYWSSLSRSVRRLRQACTASLAWSARSSWGACCRLTSLVSFPALWII